MNFDHILIPTDLSPLSLRPIEQAPELFEDHVLTPLCAVEDVPTVIAGAPFAPPMPRAGLPARISAAKTEPQGIAKALPGARKVCTEAFGGWR